LSLESTWQRLSAQLGRPAALVVELGAGTGLAGLAVAVAVTNRVSETGEAPPPTFLLTDLAAVVPLIQRNVARNHPLIEKATVAVAPLVWGDRDSACAALGPGRQADLVLGADLCYRQPNVAPLLAALSHVLRVGGIAVLALDTTHCPEAVIDFLSRAKQPDGESDEPARYDVRHVDAQELPEGFACDDITVVELHRVE
jgi:predicted nicotinamide N-methyase